MSEKVRLYRHFSAAELDTKFVTYSILHRQEIRLQASGLAYSEEKLERLERLLVLIDEERDIRI